MAKRKPARRAKSGKSARKATAIRRSAKRPTARRPVKRKTSATTRSAAQQRVEKAGKRASPKPVAKNSPKPVAKKRAVSRPSPKASSRATKSAAGAGRVPRLDRVRRTLDERETRDTPPSSLDLDRRGSAARTGRAEIAQNIREHHGMDDVTGGDPDVDIEDAYFAGEEAPGGDNPTPDQDIVEDIGKALGVTYEDSEELQGSDKVVERDKHRWELDPASAEDFKDRK